MRLSQTRRRARWWRQVLLVDLMVTLTRGGLLWYLLAMIVLVWGFIILYVWSMP